MWIKIVIKNGVVILEKEMVPKFDQTLLLHIICLSKFCKNMSRPNVVCLVI